MISRAPIRIAGTVNTLTHPFSPVPLGADLAYHFGDPTALPIVGNFDPPIATPAVAQSSATGATTPAASLTTNQKLVASMYYDILGLRARSFGPESLHVATRYGGLAGHDRPDAVEFGGTVWQCRRSVVRHVLASQGRRRGTRPLGEHAAGWRNRRGGSHELRAVERIRVDARRQPGIRQGLVSRRVGSAPPTRRARPLIWRRWPAAKREPSWLPPSWDPTSAITASSTSSTCSFTNVTPT